MYISDHTFLQMVWGGGHGQVTSILKQCEELAFTVAWQGLTQRESRIGSDNDVSTQDRHRL